MDCCSSETEDETEDCLRASSRASLESLSEREGFGPVSELRFNGEQEVCVLIHAEAEAIEVGLAAVHNEPLRESAHRAVISVHLAEGNRSEALRHYAYYRQLVNDELGIEPSTRMEMLVRGA